MVFKSVNTPLVTVTLYPNTTEYSTVPSESKLARPYGDSIYSNIKAPAFSGYICGYEGSKTFLQLPIFIQTDSELSINEITNISLTGDKVTFPCSDYSLSSFTESKYDGYKFATLSFRMSLEKRGNFQLSKINIVFSDQSEAQLNLGEINLDIRANQAPEIEYLSMSQFFVNQAEPSTLRISYTNNTNEPITIFFYFSVLRL